MRTISREEHELILNLFIMEFMQDNSYQRYPYLALSIYNMFIETKEFLNLKICFPMDEYCSVSQRNVNYITVFCPTSGEIFKEV